MRFRVIVADPPWSPDDGLTMSDVKRGAASQYPVLTTEDIKALDVQRIASKNSVLALWVPSSMLEDGMETMAAWGFTQKQMNVWVKIKKEPLKKIAEEYKKKYLKSQRAAGIVPEDFLEFITNFDLDEVLDFNLGRLFRQTHEVCLVGTRGKVYDKMKNRSQRSVHFYSAKGLKHSEKPEKMQDQLNIIFPKIQKLELFARRERPDYITAGLECPATPGERVDETIARLAKGKPYEFTDCGGSKRYMATKMPDCLGGHGCSACWKKWIEVNVT